MNLHDWLYSQETINKSKKQYAHFDYRTTLASQREYITNPRTVAIHGFYPFIHYEKKMVKYSRTKGKTVKTRDICYAAHVDRCIYQYYNFLLNTLYNERVKKDGTDFVAVAYRTDLRKNNIHFSKMAFDYIRSHSPCYVMIGDFTGFFDNLDHQYLKKQWCSLLGVSKLPDDHYAVFKSVTRYSKWELVDLLKLNGFEDTAKGRRALNSQSRVLTPEMFRANKAYIQKNENCFGIPQGSPISGLLANVYMLDVDKQINDIVADMDGLYMRYSDDFIIVLPNIEKDVAIREISQMRDLLNGTAGLSLQPDKTQYFYFDGCDVVNCGTEFHSSADCRKRFINFLGFTFDGKAVTVRSKTTTKYYYRMYRKAKTIANSGGYTPTGKRISAKNLYQRYSIRGSYGQKGNYLSYVSRAKKIFGSSESIDRDTKRHMQKIKKALKGQ